MTYRQLRIKEHSISYVCKTSYYSIPWEVDDPTTVHAEFVKGEESQPLEYGEEFTVDCDTSMLTLLTDYNNSDILHIFEGEKLKYIAKSSAKHSPKTLTKRIDDCMEEVNKIPPQIQSVEERFKQEINKIPPQINKVEKDLQEEIKNTATIVQAHSLSLIDQIKTLDEHEKRLTATATKEDISNLKDTFVTPDELQSLLESTNAKIQAGIKILEQDIKSLKDASSGKLESLKKKLEDLVTVQEKLKKLKADIAEQITRLENKTDSIETGSRNLSEVVSTLCQRVDNVDIIQMDRDVTSLARKSVEVDKTLEALEKRPLVDLTPIETKVKTLEDIPDSLKKLEEVQTRKTQELEKLKAEKVAKEEIERLEAEVVKKEEFERLKAKAVEKKDLQNLVTTDGMRAYLEEHTTNVEAGLKAVNRQHKDLEDKIKALEPLKDRFTSDGDFILQATEQNKMPAITLRGQDGEKIAQMFIRDGSFFIGKTADGKLIPCIKLGSDGFKVDGETLQQHIKAEKDPRYGELIHSELVTKIGDIYDGRQIWHWIYGEGITPPPTPEERLKKWRVVRNHAGTGRHCRGAFIEHNG